jgi:hypothetical protein
VILLVVVELVQHFHHKILSQAVVIEIVKDLKGIAMKIVELLLMTIEWMFVLFESMIQVM